METLQILRDLILIVGTCIAVYGIDSWRREHRGKRQLELAEEHRGIEAIRPLPREGKYKDRNHLF